MVVNLIGQLMNIGFSEYEAKTYLALLKVQPATAYETAKNAGIPSSKIYETLGRLKDRGIAIAIKSSGKLLYAAADPEELIEMQKASFEKTISGLEKGLKNTETDDEVSYIWNIHDYDYLIDKAIRLINNAGKNILLSVWKEEYSFLRKSLDSCRIPVAIVHFGKPENNDREMFLHPIEDTIYSEKGGRGFSLVVDSSYAVNATISEDRIVNGAWSANPGFAVLAEDYIKHDVYIMKIVSRFDDELIKKFGKKYRLLRDIFSDKEM